MGKSLCFISIMDEEWQGFTRRRNACSSRMQWEKGVGAIISVLMIKNGVILERRSLHLIFHCYHEHEL